MTEWKIYKIGDIIDEIAMGPFGSNIKVDNFIDFGVPVLNGANLQGFKLKEESFNYVSSQKADSLGKANAYRGDIVITHRGTLGQIVYIPNDSKFDRYIISQSQFRVRLNSQYVLPEYFVYYFHTRIGQHKMLMNASQVGVPALARPTSTFKEITIELPPLEEQRRIAGILGAIDDKIENNRRINTNLELQAQALYKQWFVDNRSDDWEEKKLSDFFNVVTGKKDANFSTKDGVYPFFTCSQDVLNAPDYSFEGAAILLAGNGDFNVKRYIGKFEAYQRTYVLIPFDRKYHSFLYLTIKYYLQEITGGSRGSVIKFITKGNIADFEIAMPRENIDDKLAVLDSIYQSIDGNAAENNNLATLRDTLLPKLMNGEIKL